MQFWDAGAVVKACFNPHIVKKGENAATCTALGSQDSRLTVWMSSAKRPFVIGSKLFNQSVVDMAWTPDGYCLLACSTDGTVAVLHFDKEELGEPLDQVSQISLLVCKHVCCLPSTLTSSMHMSGDTTKC